MSDLDFLLITKDAVTPEQFTALRALHQSLRAAQTNRLYTNYEGVYVTMDQAREPLATPITAPHLGSDGHFSIEQHGAEIIIDLWKVKTAGFVVIGAHPRDVIGAITLENALTAQTDLFKSWWLPKLQRQEAMDAEYQAYAVLTMARILHGLALKQDASKRQAAAWLMIAQPDFASLVAAAAAWRPGTPLQRQDEVYALIAYVDRQIEQMS